MKATLSFIFSLIALVFLNGHSRAQNTSPDTLKIMTYNVLHYGDGCQGTNSFLHANLKTIVQYVNPDVLGMVKAQVIKLTTTDLVGVSPVGFADSILMYGFNAAYPNQYDHCPVVNFSNDQDADMDLLFYNKNKLGFLSVSTLCGIQEDFNLYKLYYKDASLSKTKDTTFLYFILNHTISGTSSAGRDLQDSTIVKNLRKIFMHLPNLISMGDFNTHSSLEPGYQLLTASSDTSFTFFDPPYFPDAKLNYPSNWSSDASSYSAYLNTSTRQTTLPNSCGTANGGKGWYLHILASPWVIKNKNYISYIPNSYVTIGNDGNRFGLSINDSTTVPKNISVPANVLNALYELSDKYPIMVKLAVTKNTTGTSPPDPLAPIVTGIQKENDSITTSNPIENKITIYFPSSSIGEPTLLAWYDLTGRILTYEEFTINDSQMTRIVDLNPGVYILNLEVNGSTYRSRILKK